MNGKRLPWGTFSIVWILLISFFAQEYWLKSISNDQNEFNWLQEQLFGLEREKALIKHQWWRLITSFLLHHNLSHLVNNISLFIVSAFFIEKRKGTIFLLALFISSAIGGSLLSICLNKSADKVYEVGASGGLYGIIFALILIRGLELITHRKQWLDKIVYIIIVFLAFSFLFSNPNYFNVNRGYQINQLAHLGGAITGVFLLSIHSCIPGSLYKYINRIYLIQITIAVLTLIYRIPSTIQDYAIYKSILSIDNHANDLFNNGKFEQAKITWETHFENFPIGLKPYYQIALCCYNLKDYNCAKSYLDTAIASNADDLESKRLIAKIAFFNDKNYQVAEKIYSDIIKTISPLPDDYRLMTLSILKQDLFTEQNLDKPIRHKDLIATISEGLKRYPTDINLLTLGFNLSALGDETESLKKINEYGLKLLELKALPPEYLKKLIMSLTNEGKCSFSKEVLDRYKNKHLSISQKKYIEKMIVDSQKYLLTKCSG